MKRGDRSAGVKFRFSPQKCLGSVSGVSMRQRMEMTEPQRAQPASGQPQRKGGSEPSLCDMFFSNQQGACALDLRE